MAERVFRTLKPGRCSGGFNLRGFITLTSALIAVKKAIINYNRLRPHASVGYLTPKQTHLKTVTLPRKWYRTKKIVKKIFNILLNIHLLYYCQPISVVYVRYATNLSVH